MLIFLEFIFVIIMLVWLANRIRESSDYERTKYLSVKDKINFDSNMLNFKKNLETLNNNTNGYSTHSAKNFKALFDKIYTANLKIENTEVSFKNFEILQLTINYYIENKEKISDPSTGYRALDTYYEHLNKHLLEFNNIYFPLIRNINIEDYFESLKKLLRVNDSEEIVDRIGINNSNLIYTSIKNIDYLYLRQDITEQQKKTLENLLRTKLGNT